MMVGSLRTSSFRVLIYWADESYHVCNKGYLSLFPFLLSVLPPSSEHLGPILDMLSDPKELWSSYGIRSLSASHPDFGQGENYWKGPIWIQMNYLVLRALHQVRYHVFDAVRCSFAADIRGARGPLPAKGAGDLS
jgi:glycogen debranching enzyme